jgi:hypothetical protein
MGDIIQDFDNLTNFLSNNNTSRRGIVDNNIEIDAKQPLTSTSLKTLVSNSSVYLYRVIKPMVRKDMRINTFDDQLTPYNYPDFFPNMSELTDSNIVAGDKSEGYRIYANYWRDWGDDIFDDWGYFYIYDVTSEKYYFPLLNPINADDGVITTQTVTAFERTFVITHGWCSEGIFKYKITCNDNLPFRFGAYGEMGSDNNEVVDNLSYNYTRNSTNLTLYYNRDAEENNNTEILYSYVIPVRTQDNNQQTYTISYNSDNMSLVTNEVTKGVIVYFSKTKDVKQWVVNDLTVSGNIIS